MTRPAGWLDKAFADNQRALKRKFPAERRIARHYSGVYEKEGIRFSDAELKAESLLRELMAKVYEDNTFVRRIEDFVILDCVLATE